MKIVSWDIAGGMVNGSEDLDYIAATLKELGADLILLKGVEIPDEGIEQATRIAHALDITRFRSYPVRRSTHLEESYSGYAILSTKRLISSDFVSLGNANLVTDTAGRFGEAGVLFASVGEEKNPLTVGIGDLHDYKAAGLSPSESRFSHLRKLADDTFMRYADARSIVSLETSTALDQLMENSLARGFTPLAHLDRFHLLYTKAFSLTAQNVSETAVGTPLITAHFTPSSGTN